MPGNASRRGGPAHGSRSGLTDLTKCVARARARRSHWPILRCHEKVHENAVPCVACLNQGVWSFLAAERAQPMAPRTLTRPSVTASAVRSTPL